MQSIEFKKGDIVTISKKKIEQLADKDYMFEPFSSYRFYITRAEDGIYKISPIMELKNDFAVELLEMQESFSSDELELFSYEDFKLINPREYKTDFELDMYFATCEFLIFKELAKELGSDSKLLSVVTLMKFNEDSEGEAGIELFEDEEMNTLALENPLISFNVTAGAQTIYLSSNHKEPIDALAECLKISNELKEKAKQEIANFKKEINSDNEELDVQLKLTLAKLQSKFGSKQELVIKLKELLEEH